MANLWNLMFMAVLGYFEEFLCLILVTKITVNYSTQGMLFRTTFGGSSVSRQCGI